MSGMCSRRSRAPIVAAADSIDEPINQVTPDIMDLIVEDSFDELPGDKTDQAGEEVWKTIDLIAEDSFDEIPRENTDKASEVVSKTIDLTVEDSFDQVPGENTILATKDSVGEVVMDTMDKVIEDSELSGEESLAEWVTDSLDGEGNKRDEDEPEADIFFMLHDLYEAAMKEVIEENAAMHEAKRRRVRDDILRICVPLFF